MWQEYRWSIILGAASLVCVLVSLLILFSSFTPAEPIEFSSDAATSSSARTITIRVDVAGAVARPGVYELVGGSRVEDAIHAAGGLSDGADTEAMEKAVNRAAKLTDGAKLYIPLRQPQSPEAQPQGLHTTGSVSVNSATQDELEELEGVGPVTAQKIIAGRPYTSLEELVVKKALSQSLFEKLKSQLSL